MQRNCAAADWRAPFSSTPLTVMKVCPTRSAFTLKVSPIKGTFTAKSDASSISTEEIDSMKGRPRSRQVPSTAQADDLAN